MLSTNPASTITVDSPLGNDLLSIVFLAWHGRNPPSFSLSRDNSVQLDWIVCINGFLYITLYTYIYMHILVRLIRLV
jgi:hypothetical protein